MLSFPAGFAWGASTSAYQIEGAVTEDGRGLSIWDTFTGTPGRVHHGDTAAIACDSYHRSAVDLDLVGWLGLSAYRFSIAWPRVLPTGRGTVNRAGLDHYRQVLEGLHQRGVTPFVTLYHWDLPQALQDLGGWAHRDTAAYFADYAAVVQDAVGDLVPYWLTLNEPWGVAYLGHLDGRFAPGVTDEATAVSVAENLRLAHAGAYEVLRGEVGLTLNLVDVHPATDRPDDIAAADHLDAFRNRQFLEPLPPLDFLGVSYYESLWVSAVAGTVPPVPPLTDGGLGVRPEGLRAVLGRVARAYPDLPLYVTENGAAFHDYVDPSGNVHDPERVAFLDGHLRACRAALDDGVDLRGYFVWSLMDNYEWIDGYSRRFGITYVDYRTQQRIPKASAHWYRAVVAANGLITTDDPVTASGPVGTIGSVATDGRVGISGPVAATGLVVADGLVGTSGPVAADGSVAADGPVDTDGPVAADGPVDTDGLGE